MSDNYTVESILTEFFNKHNCRYVCIYEFSDRETHLVANVSDFEVETVLENIMRDFKEGNFKQDESKS